jgi:hypothetical protein
VRDYITFDEFTKLVQHRRNLKRLRILEVSAVDKPAQEGATARIIKRDNTDMDTTLVKIAKAMVYDNFETQAFNRSDFYDAIVRRASELRKAKPELTKEQAFAKVVEIDEDAKLLMAAMPLAVDGPMRKSALQTGRPDIYANTQPSTVSGDEARAVDNPESALRALAEAKRKSNPKLSREQAFALVYQENLALAQAEREQRLQRMSPLQAFGIKQ